MPPVAATLEFREATKRYPGADAPALDGLSLTVEAGEICVLVGPSGCGKTTALRMVAGLEDISEGFIRIGDKVVNRVPPRDRDVAMVFQSYALYPHMTVRQNLGYALRVRKTGKEEKQRRVEDVARLVGLEDLLERRPSELSGGQRQRVAMGRALVREPEAYLMDEPLSNLDAKLRVGMRTELARLHERLGTTTIYVTHDQVEALTLGQRVAVMRDGRLQQVDDPRSLYRSPVNLFVAAFIGTPSMNLVEATIDRDSVSFGGFTFPLDRERRPTGTTNGRVILGLRPEGFQDAAFAERGLPTIDVDVAVLEDIGSDSHVIFSVDVPRVDIAEVRAAREDEEESLLADSGSLFNARVDPRTQARRGSRLTLAVEPAQFYFFDPETHESLLQRPGGHPADGRASQTVPAG
jgi:multiple sugar transport system ATP-binding protein